MEDSALPQFYKETSVDMVKGIECDPKSQSAGTEN
jgi:hypothetical protein